MIGAIFFCFFVICIGFEIANAKDVNYCQLPCSKGSHTVCNREKVNCGPDPKCGPDFRVITLKDEDRQAILDLHNQLRNKVASGQEGRQPSATNMMALSYNKELEFVAQCWANACNGNPLQHDDCRSTSDFNYVGKNLGRLDSTNPKVNVSRITKDRILSWYNEVEIFDPSLVGEKAKRPHGRGHYTQMVWAETTEVGCAISYYSTNDGGKKWYQVLLACNYGPAGNYNGRPVYRTGRPASMCPGDSKNGKYRGLCGMDRSLKGWKSTGMRLSMYSYEILFIFSLRIML